MVRFEAQSAADAASLDAAPLVLLAEVPDDAPPADIAAAFAAAGVELGALLRLRITLLSEDDGRTPIVHGYRVLWECPAIFG